MIAVMIIVLMGLIAVPVMVGILTIAKRTDEMEEKYWRDK